MKPETRSFYEQAILRVIDRVVSNLDAALELETLARDACLSPFHFHRVFRGMVGETPIELIRRLRMERAAFRLATSDTAVTEVAFDAGYETHEAFTRAFRSYYSTSPSGFRQRKYPRIEIAAACGIHFTAGAQAPAFVPRDTGGQHMKVDIKHMPEMRVGTVRHIGPYNQIPQAFERLGEIAAPSGLQQSATDMIAIYYDDPESMPLDQLRSDAGLVVSEDVPLPNGLAEQHIAGGDYACAVHVGPYERLGDAWARFMGEWLPASGRRIGDGPSFEIYKNTPMNARQEELRTELYIPLA